MMHNIYVIILNAETKWKFLKDGHHRAAYLYKNAIVV